MFDDVKITRIPGTFADRSLRPDGPITQAMADVTVRPPALSTPISRVRHEAVSSIADQNHFLIEHETLTKVWTPKLKGGLVSLKFRDQALKEVGASTDSRLEYLDTADVIIRSSSPHSITSALLKLNNLDSMAHSRLQYPHVSFYIHPEKKRTNKQIILGLQFSYP